MADNRSRDLYSPSPMSAAEWEARVDLAATYRLFDLLGWHEYIYNHITLRVPDCQGSYLINPFGLLYREITATSLVKVDQHGNVLGGDRAQVNPAGFVVHSAVHNSRDDAHCVMHTHTTTGMAVACLADGLSFDNFPACFFRDRVAYHKFEGITLDLEECERLARNLEGSNALIMRNHGLLTCGRTIADAFAELYHLQRACDVQITTMSTGQPINVVDEKIARRVSEQFTRTARDGVQNGLFFSAMKRWVTKVSPGFDK